MLQRLQKIWIRIDRPFFWICIALIVVGLFAFMSAALSVLAESPSQFYRMLISHAGLGFVGGGVAAIAILLTPYQKFSQFALGIFIVALIATAAVFIPGLGLTHGGATRWISLGFISFQPAEFLKIAFVIVTASWYAWAHKKVQHWRFGILPLLVVLGVTGGILLAQPDTGTFLVIALTAVSLYFVSGARLKDLFIVGIIGIVAAGGLIATRPYVLDRFKTFVDPLHDPQGASYQVRQAFIAVGSGGAFGKGYGRSVQKFDYLPEPAGDMVFAVVAEETGFAGSLLVIMLYIAFALRGLHIAKRSPNMFSRLLVTGLVCLIVIQSFINIASVVGVFPLTGLPLIFMSHGGTALFFAISSIAIILNVSMFRKRIKK